MAADNEKIIATLNRILELEMGGVVRYTRHSLMVYGYNRIPIVSWLRGQANESLTHAQNAGEMITTLGGYPSFAIAPFPDTRTHDIGEILRESLEHERAALRVYHELLSIVRDHSVMLEEYARSMIAAEEQHQSEVDKMLRRPG
jgi:bacterioferritin